MQDEDSVLRVQMVNTLSYNIVLISFYYSQLVMCLIK